MRVTRKTNLKILAGVLMCVFSLFSVFAGSIAWFNVTQAATNNANEMGVSSLSGMFEEMTIYKCLNIDSDGTYQFNQTSWGTLTYDASSETVTTDYEDDTVTECAMGEYSYLSKNHPVLLYIKLADAYTNFSINATTDQAYMGDGTYTLTASGNPLSSVIRFYSAASSDTLTAGTFTDATSTTYSTYDLSGLDDLGGFVTFDENGDYASMASTKELFSTTSEAVQYITVVIDYYEDSLEYIYNLFLGELLLNDNLDFVCDWTVVI